MPEQLTLAFEDAVADEVAVPVAVAAIEPDGSTRMAPSPEGSPGARRKSPSRLDCLEPPAGADRPATVQGCLVWLETQLGHSAPEAKVIRGAAISIAVVVHRTEDRRKALAKDLPANPIELRPLLANAMPAAFAVSARRWSNAKSLLKTLLIAAGWVSPDARSRLPLHGPWASTLQMSPSNELGFAVRPFLKFCERRAVLPHDISVIDLVDYETWLTNETLELSPRTTISEVQSAWRRLGRICPSWPQRDITVPSRRAHKTLPLAIFPKDFEVDLNACLMSLRDPDPLDPNAGRPMAKRSVEGIRSDLMRAASCLAQSGVPTENITSVAALVEPAAFHAILMALFEDGKPALTAAGEHVQWTRVAEAIAFTLVTVAKRWVKVPGEVLEQLRGMRKMVKPRFGGLSNRVQDRLADFSTDEDRQALCELPWRAFEVADDLLRKKDFKRAPALHETALALALLLEHPLRRGNLVRLDLDRHLIRDRRGRLTQVSIPASEVKNRVSIRFDLSPDLAARIDRHCQSFRPLIRGHDASTALFPGIRGGSRQPGTMARSLGRLVEKQLGKKFNPHLARHLAVDVILEASGGAVRPAQRLLGHRSSLTTERIYGSRVTLVANRNFQELLRKQAAQVAAKTRRATQGRRRKPPTTRSNRDE